MENIELFQYDLMTVVENGLAWGNQKKIQKKFFLVTKSLNSWNIFRIYPTFQGLIHKINLIALGSSEWSNS